MTTISNPPLSSRAATRKTRLGTGIGNAVEWYDWAIGATRMTRAVRAGAASEENK